MVELLWFIPDKIYGCQANEFMEIQYDNTPISISIGTEITHVKIKRLDMLVIVNRKFSVASN